VPDSAAASKFGVLLVKVVKGVDIKSGQGMFGKADPYAKLKIGAQEQQTKPDVQGGKAPVWNQEFEFQISTEKELELDIFDKEQVGSDKFMGRAKVGIMDWIAMGNFQGDIPILDMSEKEVGKVNVSVKFDRPGANAMQAAKQQQAAAKGGMAGDDATAMVPSAPKSVEPPRDPSGMFTDEEIWVAFQVRPSRAEQSRGGASDGGERRGRAKGASEPSLGPRLFFARAQTVAPRPDLRSFAQPPSLLRPAPFAPSPSPLRSSPSRAEPERAAHRCPAFSF
jgi:hypothetical protein